MTKHYSFEDATCCSAYLQIKRSACYFRRQNTSLRATFLTRMNYVCCVSFTNTGYLLFHGEISVNMRLAKGTPIVFRENNMNILTMHRNGNEEHCNKGATNYRNVVTFVVCLKTCLCKKKEKKRSLSRLIDDDEECFSK